MPVTGHSLCIGTPPLVYVPPRSNRLPSNVNFRRRSTSTVFMQLKTGVMSTFDRKGLCFVSKSSKRSVFAYNAALNTKCSIGQTQTITRPRQSPTITKTPTHERSPKLDDGGNGLPPRDGGGGGGGGGGDGMSSSGGFFLFGFLLFMAYLKDLEEEQENQH